ncbi:MAG: zinc-binding dehydrogenase [Actinobacteria bacterium]|nr:zinc-binding dehydrogenase [Actinomycetota bacterium]
MTATMRALRLDVLHPRAVLALAAGRFRSELYHGGAGSPLRSVDAPAPDRPAGWVRVRPTLSGICGSDLKLLKLLNGFSPSITALVGMPRRTIPGHEIVGTVTEADDDAGVAVGGRVAVDPLLGCRDKGLEPCPECRAGRPQVCHATGRSGMLTPGHGSGYNAAYGGGWAEQVVAPAARVHPVPDDLEDTEAVLTEPMAVAVQAVGRDLPPPGARVLVIGPGTIGICLVHALRSLSPEVHITVAALDDSRDAALRAAGAHAVIHGTRRDLVTGAGHALGVRVAGSRLSGPVLEAGFDVVYDCIGSDQTLDDATRMTRPRGTTVLVGTAGRRSVDWTFVWLRDLTIRGTFSYGHVDALDGRHAFDAALDILRARRPSLVTHVFRLEERVTALEVAEAGPAADAVKVAFVP